MNQYNIIKKEDGKKYTIRNDRKRFFYPQEWKNFINTFTEIRKRKKGVKLSEQKYLLFCALLYTGGRINEVSHIKVMDFDFERNLLKITTTKTKAKKGEKMGKPRTIRIPKILIKMVKDYIQKSKKEFKDWLFLDKEHPTEKDFDNFNKNAYQVMKRHLEQIKLNPLDFSLHNIRKTTGNWLKAQRVPPEEICLILGHDFNTYREHYGSPNVFDRTDLLLIEEIFGYEYFEAIRGDRR